MLHQTDMGQDTFHLLTAIILIIMMLPFNIGVPEVIVILGIALIIFGPKKLPELGRNLGKGLKNFKDSLSSAASEMKAGFKEDDKSENSQKEELKSRN